MIVQTPTSEASRTTPVPFPKGGFATAGEEATWLADAISNRITDMLRNGGINCRINVIG